MYRIIPFFIFMAMFAYLFYGPAPMDKIGEMVETRDCYHLRLIDQKRLSIKKEEKNYKNSTASVFNLQKVTESEISDHHNFEKITLVVDQKSIR